MMVVMENKKISYKQARKVLAKRDPYVGVLVKEVDKNLKILLARDRIMRKKWES